MSASVRTQPAARPGATIVQGFEPLDASEGDVRLFPPEGSAEGCASGECLPTAAAPTSAPSATAPAAPVAAAAAGSSAASPSTEPSAPDDAEPDDVPPPEAPAARDDLSLSLTERWRQAVEGVRRVSPRQGASLAFARLLWLRPGEVAVAFQPAHGFHKATVVSASGKAAIEQCFQKHFGRPTVLKIEALPAAPTGEVTVLPGPSLAEQDLEVRRRRDQETEATVRTHPAVRATLRLLGGEIEHIQMLEPEPKTPLGPVEGEPSAAEDA